MTYGEAYFAQYPFNIPITLFNYLVMNIAKLIGIPESGYMLTIQCVYLAGTDLAVFFSYRILRMLRSRNTATLFALLCIINPLMYMYGFACYTTILMLPFLMGNLLLFFTMLKEKRPKRKIIYAFLLGVAFILGTKIRANLLITLITFAGYLIIHVRNADTFVEKKKQVVFLLLGGMPLFESMLTAFGTAGTGGFGFKNDSFTSFSPYIQWVVTIFMILFGVNFNAYFLLLLRKFNRAISEEVRGYFAIILVAIGIITANIYSLYNSFGEAVRQAAFQVGSIITTTGFSSCDFDLWPTLSKEILVVLMFIGACAGSTGGGIKVSRLLILGKTLGKELKQALHPQVVAPVRMDGKLLNHETIRTTNVFMGAYFFIFVVSFLLISLDGFDMVTNFTAIAATLNNIGPGLAQVGPMMNFGSFTNPAKLVMIFDMLAGRLEIFPMLVLFLPDTWRRF